MLRKRFVPAGSVLLGVLLCGLLPAQSRPVSSHYPIFDPGATYRAARSRAFHVKHYKLVLSLDQQKEEIAGVDTITLVPFRDGLQHIELDSSSLAIDKVTTADGTVLAFQVKPGKLLIDLPKPLQGQSEVTVSIQYHGHPSSGLYFINPGKEYTEMVPEVWTQGESEFNHFWFPCYDSPNDKASSEVIVTVPQNEVVVSNGKLVSVDPDSQHGTKTYHWVESIPHSTYLTSLVVGPFKKFEARLKGIPVEYYVAPHVDEETALRSFGLTPDMIDFFATITGHVFPYEKYAQSAVERYGGGMENISATTQTDQTLHPQRAEQDDSSLGLVAHELAHQWFGDLVTCSSWSDIWLNEGFASFFESLYREHHLGHEEYRQHLEEFQQRYFREDRRYRRPIVTHYYKDEADMFDATTYRKGARVLDMLRYVVGDKAFFRGIKHYLDVNQRKNVVTFDFEKAMEEATGRNLHWFFNEWVHHAGYPEIKVRADWNESTKIEHIHVEQTQYVDVTTRLFQMPLDIRIQTEAGTKNFPVKLKGRSQDFYFPLGSRPTLVLFDPGDHILKKLDFEKSSQELALQLEDAAEAQDRRWAAQELASRRNDAAAVEALDRALHQDSFYAVRAAAAWALGNLGSGEARKALLSGLQDSNSRVRGAIASALGHFPADVEVASVLKGLLNQDDSYAVQAEAAVSLAHIRADHAFEILQQKLEAQPYRTVARGIFSAFNRLKDKRALPIAVQAAAYGKPDYLRSSAARTLGVLGKGDPQAFQQLMRMASDHNVFMRVPAIRALGALKNREALSKLREITARAGKGGRFGNAGVGEVARDAIREIESAGSSDQKLSGLRTRVEELERSNRRLKKELEELKKGGH